MYVTNITRIPISVDGRTTLPPGAIRVFVEDNDNYIERAKRLIKAKQISVSFTDSIFAIAEQDIKKNEIIHISEVDDGILYCKRASDSGPETSSHGFSAEDCKKGEVLRVYLEGLLVYPNTLQKNLVYYLGSTPGTITTTKPITPGKIRQQVGVAITTDLLFFINKGYDIIDPTSTVINSMDIKMKTVRYTMQYDTDNIIRLPDVPFPGSDQVFWRGLLMHDYTILNNSIVINDGVPIRKGDDFTIKYMVINEIT